jgi:hypothetical protein
MGYATYSNHLTTKIHACTLLGVRQADNPCTGIAYSEPVPSKYKRIALLLQNQGTTEVDITFQDGKPLKLYAGQSINFDNYNGGFTPSDLANLAIFETFA